MKALLANVRKDLREPNIHAHSTCKCTLAAIYQSPNIDLMALPPRCVWSKAKGVKDGILDPFSTRRKMSRMGSGAC